MICSLGILAQTLVSEEEEKINKEEWMQSAAALYSNLARYAGVADGIVWRDFDDWVSLRVPSLWKVSLQTLLDRRIYCRQETDQQTSTPIQQRQWCLPLITGISATSRVKECIRFCVSFNNFFFIFFLCLYIYIVLDGPRLFTLSCSFGKPVAVWKLLYSSA